MNKWLIRSLLILAYVGPLACSDNAFKSAPNATCTQYQRDFGSAGCVVTPTGFQFNYRVTSGEVDMLFVDDNSGSMYQEQVKMADRFPGFLDTLFRLDYRIAIVTTDIYTNGGGFQPFPDGTKVLSNNSRVIDAKHAANITHFQNTIKRQETLNCDTSGYQNCPSGDERGIYAMNLAIGRADQKSFFRPGGHLAVVILSDENERSSGDPQIHPDYPLESLDMPLTFVERTKQYLGTTKSVSVHSIIIKPGDTNCYNIQNSQGSGTRGFFGTYYAQLSQPNSVLRAAGNIGSGVLGSICSTNYTTELGNIAAQLNQHKPPVLPCLPDNNQVSISYDPGVSQQITYTINPATRELHVSPTPYAGQHLNLAFSCARL